MSISIKSSNQSGFTIIECILAIGILSAVLASIVGLQSSILSNTQLSADKTRANWAMHSALAQVDYLLDVQGQMYFPEKSTFPWAGNETFVTTVERKDLKEVKFSQFLMSALKINNLISPTGDANLDIEKNFAPIVAIMDSMSPNQTQIFGNSANIQSVAAQSDFSNILINVKWNNGEQKHSFSSGIFLIDTNGLRSLLASAKKPSSNSSSDKEKQGGSNQNPNSNPGSR